MSEVTGIGACFALMTSYSNGSGAEHSCLDSEVQQNYQRPNYFWLCSLASSCAAHCRTQCDWTWEVHFLLQNSLFWNRNITDKFNSGVLVILKLLIQLDLDCPDSSVSIQKKVNSSHAVEPFQVPLTDATLSLASSMLLCTDEFLRSFVLPFYLSNRIHLQKPRTYYIFLIKLSLASHLLYELRKASQCLRGLCYTCVMVFMCLSS